MKSLLAHFEPVTLFGTSPDEEHTARARALRTILWTLIGVGTLTLIVDPLVPGSGPITRLMPVVGALYLLSTMSFYLIRRRKTLLVSVLLVIGTSIVITWLSFTAGGMRAGAVIWYVVIVAGAGLLLGEVAGLLAAGLVSLLSLALVVIESKGYLPADVVTHTPTVLWLGLLWTVVAIACIQFLGARTVRRAFSRTRQELREREKSEALFRAVVENSHDAVVLLDINRKIKYVSPSFSRIGGYSPRELEATYGPAYTHPDDKAYTEKKFREVLESPGTSASVEYRVRHKLGHWIWVEVRINNLLDDPAVKALVLNLRNITDRKQADEALRKSESYYRALINNTPDIVSGFDRDGRYLFVNNSVSKVSPLPPSDFIGRQIGDVPGFTPEQAALRRRLIERVFETREPYEGEFRFESAQGELTFEWRVYPVLDSEGNVLSAFSINRDITERKKADEALEESMEQLHALSMELEHAREQERKTTAREVHDELGQILTAIRMGVEKVERARGNSHVAQSPETRELFDLVDHGIDAVRRIAARLRPGILDDLGLLAAIEWKVEEFQKQSGIACSLTLPDAEPIVDEDRSTALFRILGELLTNVARHAKATAVAVSLAGTADGLTMSVKDDGVGISKADAQSPHALGFKGIKERLYPFGGVCSIRPVAPRGAEVVIQLPPIDRPQRNHHDPHPHR
jgi:PAS domain S-box-containing protein